MYPETPQEVAMQEAAMARTARGVRERTALRQQPTMTHQMATHLVSRVYQYARELGLTVNCWENSTRLIGVRTARVKVIAGDQRKVTKLMKYAQDLVVRNRIKGKNYKIYTHNLGYEARAWGQHKRITRNCFKCWYVSDGTRHTKAIAK